MDKILIVLVVLCFVLLGNFILTCVYVVPHIRKNLSADHSKGIRAATWKNSSYVFVLEKMTHSAALKDCKSKGMRLVSIDTLEENEFLKEEQDHMGLGALWWTGAVLDPETKAYWKWGSNGSLWNALGTKGYYFERLFLLFQPSNRMYYSN